jgi:hypothetical protein
MERKTAPKCQVKTKSCWGTAPSRYYRHIHYVEEVLKTKINACVIGAADGKFVLPLVRRGHQVTCFEIDNIAINGGPKPFPIKPSISNKMQYIATEKPLKPESYPFKYQHIMGLSQRLLKEQLQQLANILQQDFYRSNINRKYDFVFTSCSIQYKTNRDIPPVSG